MSDNAFETVSKRRAGEPEICDRCGCDATKAPGGQTLTATSGPDGKPIGRGVRWCRPCMSLMEVRLPGKSKLHSVQTIGKDQRRALLDAYMKKAMKAGMASVHNMDYVPPDTWITAADRILTAAIHDTMAPIREACAVAGEFDRALRKT